MSIALVRLDDRLVHGQVVVGWGRAIGADRIVLVDDAIAVSDWEKDLYRTGVPPGMEIEFASIADAANGGLRRWESDRARTMVLVGNVEALVRLCDAGGEVIRRVNLGGVHGGAERTRRLPYVFLSDAELDALRGIAAAGVVVEAQDVPTATAVPLADLA